jgi:uncharacterized protein YfaS (alpha-2-macroglobulin family)/TolA-binding protein
VRFHQAEELARLGNWEEAERIWAEQVGWLRGAERQESLAGIYLELAESWTTPLSGAAQRRNEDYARARVLYTKSMDLDLGEELRGFVLERIAWCSEQQELWPQAVKDYKTYLEGYEDVQVRYAYGEALRRNGQSSTARRTFEDLAAALEAGEHELPAAEADALHGLALYAIAYTYPSGNHDGRLSSIGAFRRFLERFPEHAKTSRAAFGIASLLFDALRFEESIQAFEDFLASAPPRTEDHEELEHDARLRMQTHMRIGDAWRRLEDFVAAREAYARYVASYPEGSDWSTAQQAMVDMEYFHAATLADQGEWTAAREAFLVYLQQHPLDPKVSSVLFELGDLLRREADGLEGEGQAERRKELYTAAVEEWRSVVQRFPASEQASRALFHSGLLQEMKLDQLDAAVASYRACDFGGSRGDAADRLSNMLEESLRILTSRTWRSDEEASFTLDVRNLEKVKVEVYRLDLEAYFRKHLTHDGIDGLDLDLIAADMEFEQVIEDYGDYRPFTREVVLPVEGVGVWAVAVSSETQRATTLVLRSDLDVLVRSSREEALVFVEDMRLSKPAGGASLVLAIPRSGAGMDARMVEVTTGADGVARIDFAGMEMEAPENLRVFVTDARGVASTSLEVKGLGLSTPLQPNGYLYTERSAYLPGSMVSWRAVMREVVDESFAATPGATFRISVTDPAGRVLFREEQPASGFGTLSGQVRLAQSAPHGRYLVRCISPRGTAASSAFEVQDFELQPLQIDLQSDRRVYYRGETVVLEGEVAWNYGEPLALAKLRLRTPDGRVHALITDEEGKFNWEFDTTTMQSGRSLRFAVEAVEEGIDAGLLVTLASTGFHIVASAERKLVVAGEEMGITARTYAADGAGVARTLKATLMRRSLSREGSWLDLPVEERMVNTEEEDPTTLMFRLDQGGDYTLRLEGTDRFGNPVTTTTAFFVSGEDDEQKLRVLSEMDRLQVGDQMAFDLLNRAGDGLVLMTFEGSGILDYRIVEVREGRHVFEQDVPQAFFPEVTIAFAMMHGNRFHQTQKNFRVSRHLQVTLAPREELVRPGGEVQVDMSVVDHNGRPVQGEFSFAAVDQALFDQFPDSSGNIRRAFETGLRRISRMRSTSSNEFRYVGVTLDIDDALLEEGKRALAQQMWERNRGRAKEELGKLSDRRGRPAPEAPGSPSTPGGPSAGFFALDEEMDALGYALEEEVLEEVGADDGSSQVAMGGGAGGKFGGRSGGSRRGRKFQGGAWADGLSGQDQTESLDAMTALWLPSVLTDAEGKATITFDAPQLSTEWRLMCRGTDRDTTVGQGTATFTTRADFFLEARLPSRLLEGDTASVFVRLHNLTGRSGVADVRLTLDYPERSQQVTAQVHFGEHTLGEALLLLPDAVPGGLAGKVPMRVEAVGFFPSSESRAELALETSMSRSVMVAPWGMPVAASHSGILTDQADLTLQLPADAAYSAVGWKLQLGMGLDQLLVDEALAHPGIGNPGLFHDRSVRPDRRAAQASELLGVLGVLRHLQGTDGAQEAPYDQVRARAAGLLTTILSTQRADGGWSWSGHTGTSHPDASAMAMISLEGARTFNFDVPSDALNRGRTFLRQSLADADKRQTERRSRLLYAMSLAGNGDFAYANSLHRERDGLSPVACAFTSLALMEMKSAPMAGEMVQTMLEKLDRDGNARGYGLQCTPTEQTALALLATLKAWPSHEQVGSLEQQLMAQRPWFGEGGHGLALAALAAHRGISGQHDQDAEISVQVGNGKERLVQLDSENPSLVMEDLLEEAGARPQLRVRLRLKGRGQPHFRLQMEGFVSDPQHTQQGDLRVTRSIFLSSPPIYGGREMPVGFQRTRNFRKQWDNTVDHLAFAEVTPVRVDFYRNYDQSESQDSLDYLTLEVPLPAGTSLVDDSVEGTMQSWHLDRGVLHVDVGQHRGSGRVFFRLRGLQPGTYRTLPPVLRSAYRPDRFGIGESDTLTILDRGVESTDTYRATPDELLGLGLAAYEAGDKQFAWDHLTQLVDEYEAWLHVEPQKQAARALLTLAVERRDSSRIVQFFETLKEKDPDLSVPFARLTSIAEAYRQLGESERAARIYRAVAEETFGKDLQLVGVLQQQEDFHAASEAMYRFWLEYPDFPTVVETGVTLADTLLQKAPAAYQDASLREAKRNRAVLLFESVVFLQRFLALYPEDPVSADAALNLINAFLDLEDYRNASRLAAEFAARYTEPRFADAFLYTQAVAEWYQGEDAKAVALLQRIADATYQLPGGGTKRSDNRDLALYILAQIHHARQDFQDAADYYEKVSNVFADAREVLADFRRHALTLDEVTEVAPGETAKLELHYRNLQETEVLVYPVDLMTLYLREKNLAGITQVNLAGIEPVIRRTVALPDDASMRQQDLELELELPGAGAYLIICRSDAIHASGMVLVSDFELVVETDAQNGGVRAQAVHRTDGKYLRDVDVRVIGQFDQGFQSGHTDPRGLFVTTGVNGPATVIARHDSRHYAFFRGAGAGQIPVPQLGLEIAPGQRLDSDSYFDNVRSLNDSLQEGRSNKLRKQQQGRYEGLELNSLQ